MNRLMICLLALSLILCGCADSGDTQNTEIIKELNDAIDSTNGQSRVAGDYLIEITVSGVTLYYAKGNIAFDREGEIAYNDFSQTYMATSAVAQNYFANGKLITVEKDGVNEFERTSDQILGKFPYSKLSSLPEDIGEISQKNSSVGRTIELVRKDTAAICESVIGKDIYTLVSVIKQPQADKTQYSDTKCIYTVKDGRAIGCRYEFTAKLFDTPAYVPGYSVLESEYTVEISVVAKVNYKTFGDEVEIAEYSATEDISES